MDRNTFAKKWCLVARNVLNQVELDGSEPCLQISHNRLFSNFGECFSKSKFIKLYENLCLAEEISACGGYTTCKITLPEEILESKHNFGKKQAFCRNFATMVCVRKALSKTEAGMCLLNNIDQTVRSCK